MWHFNLVIEWRENLVARLEAASQLAETSRGPVEYAMQGDGPVVLVSHGTPGGYDFGLLVADLFRDLPVKFLAVSRPGYLQTPLETGLHPEDQADTYAALLDTLRIETVVMIGISGGGPAALQFALRHPTRCRSLLLICPVTRAYPVEQYTWRIRILHRHILAHDYFGWLLDGVSRAAPDWMYKWAGVALAMRKMASTLYPVRQRRPGHRNDGQQFSALTRYPLESIRCPALVLHGTRDSAVPFEHGRFAAETIPDVQFVALKDADHSLLALHWKEVSAIISRFLCPTAQNSCAGS